MTRGRGRGRGGHETRGGGSSVARAREETEHAVAAKTGSSLTIVVAQGPVPSFTAEQVQCILSLTETPKEG